ncbi:MAG: hypothetical protein I8H71_10865 [Xanthomonadaceae bacterium]|nr:hypothetical protein [Xanthomonadaceae bacterium]
MSEILSAISPVILGDNRASAHEGKPLFDIQPDQGPAFEIQPLWTAVSKALFALFSSVFIGRKVIFSAAGFIGTSFAKLRVRSKILTARTQPVTHQSMRAGCVLEML